MIVSNFELLIKRIATVNSNTPPNIATVFRRVVQGYFLTITNLNETRSSRFILKITITNSRNDRIIDAGNTQCFFDNGDTNNDQLTISSFNTGRTNILSYTTSDFGLGSKETGLITLLPNVIGFINEENPELEIRGYVELLQTRFGPGPIARVGAIPASTVLTTPETRGSFLDNEYPSTDTNDELDFDQIAYGLPNASGKAENIVEALPGLVFEFGVADPAGSFIKNNPGITVDEANGIWQMVEEIEKAKKKKK